ncbi:MAG TPA: TetR family transcriptional regulator [Solirubrobacteraceae bacterium]|nr:TetR family transcriptional regulator [Solirubrobacteraceae bacterium]
MASLRERKKVATRHLLMNVALERFADQGFDHTTVEEIAAAADVAPRTFFRYFPAKVDVLFADHPEEMALVRATLAARPADEPVVEAVRRAVLEGIGKAVAEPSHFLTRSRIVATVPAAHAHSRYLDSKFEDVIADAVAAEGREPASGLRARVIARASWGAACAARDLWVSSGGSADPRALVDQAFDLLQHGLVSVDRR